MIAARHFLYSLIFSLLAGTSFGQHVEPTRYYFDIPSKDVAEALTTWAEQAGLQIVVPADLTREMISRPIKGHYTAQDSVNRILAGSRLEAYAINNRTFVIREKRPSVMARQSDQPERAPVASEEVLVEGPRIVLRESPIAHDANTAGPATIIDRPQIDLLGASSISEVLQYQPQQPYQHQPVTAVWGTAYEPRGLGPNAAVVLIDGRRALPSSQSVSYNAFDLNVIPLAAVDRIELLSDSASAIYGTDVIGGVMNVITKKGIMRPTLDFHYGAAAGGAQERRVSASVGRGGESWHASVVFDTFARKPLLGEHRRWNNQNYERFGGDDYRTTTTNPGNITSLTGENLPGLPSQFAAVPVGSTGVGLTPSDLLPTAGERNRTSPYASWSVIPEADSHSLTASADVDLSPTLNAFTQFLYVDRRGTQQYGTPTATVLVPAENIYNPFGVDVSVDYEFSGIGPAQLVQDSRLYRAVAGLRGAWSQWTWELSVLRTDDAGASWSRNTLDLSRVNAALAATDPAQTLNVFRDGPGGSAALLVSLVQAPERDEYASKGTQILAAASGPLLQLPAGAADLTLGGEWTHAGILFDQDLFVEHGRTDTAAFAQLRVPLVSSGMRVPGINEMALTLAGRRERYSDLGGQLNPQYGLILKPIADLLLRASYGTARRAPALYERYAPRTTIPGIQVPDPRRNDEINAVTFVVGGNPDLQPTTAHSFNTGFVLTPGGVAGLTLSADYWHIRMRDRSGVPSFYVIAANEDLFGDRVVREPRTPEDIQRGLPGRLQSMDLSRTDIGSIDTSGVDWTGAYGVHTPIGSFDARLTATYTHKYSVVDVPGMPPIQRVGLASQQGTITAWRGNVKLGWTRRAVSLSTTARYTAAYRDADLLGAETGRKVSAQTLIDLQGTLDFTELFGEPLGGSKLVFMVGVTNLFDAEPPYSTVGSAYGYDPTQGDLRMRFVYGNLSVHF